MSLDLLFSIGFPLVFVLVFVVIIVVGLLTKGKTTQVQNNWNPTIQAFSQQMGFRHTPVESYFDVADGSIGKYRVSLSIDPSGSGSSPRFKAEIDLSVGWSFLVKGHGRQADWEGDAGQPTPSGDPALDSVIEIRGAPPVLHQEIQQQAELRALLKQVIGEWGAYISRDDLVLKTPTVPQTPEEIMAYLTPLLELARWVSEPTAPRTAPALGSITAGALRHYNHAADHEKLPILQSFLERIGSQLGQGQVFANINDREVEWRGTVSGFPTRIKVDHWPRVVVEAKVTNQHGELVLEYDADKVPQAGTLPAWDDDDAQRVFFGRGVFIEGSGPDVDLSVRRLRALPPELGDTIAETMVHNDVRFFRMQEQSVWARFGPKLTELLDPEGQLVHTTQIVGWVAGVLQSTPTDPSVAQAALNPAGASAAMAQLKMTCSYCNTVFLAGTRATCPNCGAPATG